MLFRLLPRDWTDATDRCLCDDADEEVLGGNSSPGCDQRRQYTSKAGKLTSSSVLINLNNIKYKYPNLLFGTLNTASQETC